MAALCNNSGCSKLGTKHCGSCGDACYCCVECQKQDWKVHKGSCVDLKKMPMSFLSTAQIKKYLDKAFTRAEILLTEKKVEEAAELFRKLLVFLEHQFGGEVKGTSKLRRSNGE